MHPQGVCPQPTSSVGMYTYPYMPPIVGQALGIGQFKLNPGANFVNHVVVSDPKEFKEQEKLMREFLVQVGNSKTQQKYDLLKKRLRGVGVNILGGIDATELNLVSNLVISSKYNISEFEKYNGTKCLSMTMRSS